MKKRSLRERILASFLVIIIITAMFYIFIAKNFIDKYILNETQQKVKNDLKSAHSILQNEIKNIEKAFNLITFTDNIGKLKYKLNLDYLYVIEANNKNNIKSKIAKEAFNGNCIGGFRIINEKELKKIGSEIFNRSFIKIKNTAKSIQSSSKEISSAMSIEYAMPFYNKKTNKVERVLYGGKIINRNFNIVDKIHNIIYENKLYNSKPIGTVTIFQNDVRISTNVLDHSGKRAVGTKVSEQVYNKVIKNGQKWTNRAFVVNSWYITAYEPIKNFSGKIIGMLYVGILEAPFLKIKNNFYISIISVIILVALFGVLFAYLIATSFSKCLNNTLDTIAEIMNGNLSCRIKEKNIREFNELAKNFNDMAETLETRENELKISNEKLKRSNKNYLDLVGFVSHEFKGILSSTVLNAYSLKDGYLGVLKGSQQKAACSIVKNLDHLTATVKNFLDLSRVEKNEIKLNKNSLLLKEDIINFSIENFSRAAKEKNIDIVNQAEDAIKFSGDLTLLQIATNNLISNAVKYGQKNGNIQIKTKDLKNIVEVEIYNDGNPITKEQTKRLFKKFSRLDEIKEVKNIKGTGLGLFLTKEIIEKHGGSITVKPKEKGNSFIFKLEKEK